MVVLNLVDVDRVNLVVNISLFCVFVFVFEVLTQCGCVVSG